MTSVGEGSQIVSVSETTTRFFSLTPIGEGRNIVLIDNMIQTQPPHFHADSVDAAHRARVAAAANRKATPLEKIEEKVSLATHDAC
jgi:hypothetical protein